MNRQIVIKEIQPHVAGGYADLRMGCPEFAQAFCVRTQDKPDQPIGRVIFQVERRGVPHVEQPSGSGPDGDAAMAAGMPEQRHQPHLRVERQANGLEIEPSFAAFFIERNFRLVGEVAADVGQGGPAARAPGKGFGLAAVNVNQCVGEIGQASAVVEMHVGQHDVADVLRPAAEFHDLPYGSLCGIEGHDGYGLEDSQDGCLVSIVIQTRPGVHQYQTLAGFDQQAERPAAPPGWRPGVASEAVEEVDGRGKRMAHFYSENLGF